MVRTAVGCLLLLVVSNVTQGQELSSSTRAKLAQAHKSMYERPHVVNALALVDINGGKSEWKYASGMSDPGRGLVASTDHQFRTASVSKSFTGCALLQLMEAGKFELDTPISKLLSPSRIPWKRSLEDIHRLKGKSFGEQITLRDLLNHTSGLSDYWFDKGSKGKWDGKSWLDAMLEPLSSEPDIFDPPSRLWSPNEILHFHYEVGLNERAHFPPGDGFLYSDTNYLLLGMIIEDTSGSTLEKYFRTKIFEPLGMADTYGEYRESPIGNGELMHHFWFLEGENHDIVEERLASTAEWANGGHVTTLNDLRLFIRGLFAGKLFQKEGTLQMMLNSAEIDLDQPQKYFENGHSNFNRYSCGLKRWDIEGITVWGHTGFWGIGMFYIPDADVTVILAKNQVEGEVETELQSFVSQLKASGLLESQD